MCFRLPSGGGAGTLADVIVLGPSEQAAGLADYTAGELRRMVTQTPDPVQPLRNYAGRPVWMEDPAADQRDGRV